ncbi:endoplasmic reticulum vesicle transporter-domain-containing protein [Tribonema minus]|uniref:Endoplasmic reticulum vesicle transporter-domain-containing protein n=1 Tax=Tribonema minus TaxID=303371 RepID=A0A836CGD9_9STRA|nr:endoplasmic reticulum vesicle transporter-domain-containing protein [Tribonema minus]
MDNYASSPSMLRRRASAAGKRPSNLRVDDDEDADSKLAKTLRRMDLYARVNEDLTVKTESGATVTVVFWVLLVLLVTSEVRTFLATRTSREELMRVDTSLGRKLEIGLNMTFHAINCLDLHVDAMDVAGDNQLDVEHAMLKQRLSAAGEPLAPAISEEVSQLEHRATLPRDYCGNCYGSDSRGRAAAAAERAASGGSIRCCNTCHAVVESFALRGWSTAEVRKTAEQCIREAHLEVPMQEMEGCNLSGKMRVNKVAGNFHMAMGESMVKDGRHVHIFNIDDSDTFNISHTIHSLSFGDTYPDMPANPLDGVVRMVGEDTGTGLMQYYINLVPAVYKAEGSSGEKTELVTTQFTYTMKFRSVYGYDDFQAHEHHDQPGHHHAIGEHRDVPGDEGDGAGGKRKRREITNYLLPGVFFVYDMAPFMLEVEVWQQPLSHFLIRLCAVVGGVYAVSGMLDQALYHVISHMKGRGLLPS